MPSPTDPILFAFGPFAIRWYGLLIVIGALAAGYVGAIEAKRKRENPEHMWNLLIWTLIAGIIGARIYHVLSSPPGPAVVSTIISLSNPLPPSLSLGQPSLFPRP